MTGPYALSAVDYVALEDVNATIPERAPTWGEAFQAAVQLQPFWQGVDRALDPVLPPEEPGYDPYADDQLDGFEAYYTEFLGSSSSAETERIKARIRDNTELRQRSSELGFFSMLATEFANPVNYVPLPGLAAGRGVLTVGRSVAKGGALFGAAIAVEEMARQELDPTATTEESLTNVAYGTALGGLFGGIVGTYVKVSRGRADIAQVTEAFLAETAVQGPPTREGVAPIAPAIDATPMFSGGGGSFVARPSVEGSTGVASAMGLEKVTAGMTLWRRLHNTGIRAVEDFADGFLGDFGLLLEKNKRGIPTNESVTINSGRWRGMAGDVVRDLEQVFTRYRADGGSGGVRVLDMSPAVLAAKAGRYAGRTGGKMNDKEFFDAVFRAHTQKGIVTDDPFVREGVDVVRKFFDRARAEGISTGLIRTRDGWAQRVEAQVARARELNARELELKEKKSLTNNERLHLLRLRRAQANLYNTLQSQLLRSMDIDGDLGDYILAWETRQKEFQDGLIKRMEDIKGRAKKRRANTAEALSVLQFRVDEDRRLVAYFDDLEKTRGLTDKQRAYRDAIRQALDEYDGTPTSYDPDLSNFVDPQVSGSGRLVWEATNLNRDGSYYYIEYTPENGVTVKASLTLWKDGTPAQLDVATSDIGNETARNVLGPAAMRGMFRELLDAFPDIKEIESPRVKERGEVGRMATLNADQVEKLRSTRASDEIPLTKREAEYLAKLEEMYAGKNLVDESNFSPKNEPFYLPRVWVIDEVLRKEDELRAILTKWFKDNPLEGSRTDFDSIAARVERTIDNIVGRAQKEDLQLFDSEGMGASFLRHRELDIPNELVADFIETDVTKLARIYGQRFGVMNETQRMFGDTGARDAIDDVMMQSALEVDATDINKAMSELDALETQLELARDKQTGRVYDTSEKATAARRHASYLKAYGILTSMGTAVISSLTELGRAAMVHGFRRTLGASLDALTNKAEFKQLRNDMRSWTGEGSDAALNTGVNRFINEGGPEGGSTSMVGRGLRKGTDFAYGPYFKLNLLTPFTDLMKGHSNYVAAKLMHDDIMKAADDPTVMQRLASYGLSVDDVAAIRSETVKEVGGGAFKLNLDEWQNQGAARRFAAAVGGITRQTIVTPGLADLPEVVKGFVAGREAPYITLPFQFMSWGFGAVNKIMLSGLQGRDQSAMAGAVALLGLGYMIEAIKTDEYIWDKMGPTERMVRAVDRSGLTGVFSDVPTMVETATLGEISARRAIGLEPFVRNADYFDAVGEAGGPAVGKIADIAALMVNPDADVNDYTGAIRRAVPLNNILYWKEIFRDFERGAADMLKGESQEYLVG